MLLLDTIKGKSTTRPPVWFMRQAGRILPNYLALREKYSFKELMNDPKLCSEVTLMPVHDLGVDAAILFSDILVIPEAMGMGLEFTEKGPVFKNALKDRDLSEIENLVFDESKLTYIYRNIKQIIEDKDDHIPLIGFCGAPLTTLVYMIQGLSSNHTFPDAIKFLYEEKETAKKLIDIITKASVTYALSQVKAGVDVFQLFETHAGLIPSDLYKELFFESVETIAKAVRATGTPFIYFPKGLGNAITDVTPEMADMLGIDWQMPITTARKLTDKNIGLQGNLDPRLLFGSQKNIEAELVKLKEFWKDEKKWIFNLGHGFIPGIPVENAKFVVDWIKNTKW